MTHADIIIWYTECDYVHDCILAVSIWWTGLWAWTQRNLLSSFN